MVNNPSSFDILINAISKDGLKQEVSTGLQIPCLSKYKGSKVQHRGKVKYHGKIIGDRSRVFFSIPTARKNSSEYYYVHSLLDTVSPYTALTHQPLCCLFGINVDHNVSFTQEIQCLIGGNVVQIHLSNPRQNSPHNYHNANLLGQNFLRQYKICKLEQHFKTKEAILELIQ